MTMGEFLRSLREQKQWKQPEAAQQIAIEQSYLSKLENNKAVPSTDIFQRLQQVYGFTVEQLTNELGHEELTKLKDIVSIREFVNNTRKQNTRSQRRLMVGAVIMLMLGALLFAFGIAMKDNREVFFIYESKGVIKQEESLNLFASMPEYHEFLATMEIESRRNYLKTSPLFPRLDYDQSLDSEYRGNFYDVAVEGGHRRYNRVGADGRKNPQPFYLGVSFGFMFIVGGLALFYTSRRW